MNKTKKIVTSEKAQHAYWSSSFDWEILQQVWLGEQAIFDDPHWLKISSFIEIVPFNWQLKWVSSQIYLYGQHDEPFEPQQTPWKF